MISKKYKIIIFILVIVVALLSARVILDSQYDNFQDMVKWEKDYKIDHPEASKEEIDKAFNEGMQSLEKWVDNYKIEHPDATDEEIDQAFQDAWGK